MLIVDDHTLFRQGLMHLFRDHPELEVAGEAADGLEAICKARQLNPDVVLMDVRMPSVIIAMLSVSEREDDLFEAIDAGVRGYLTKTMRAEDLIDAIGAISRGEAVVAPSMTAKLFDRVNQMRQGEYTETGIARNGITEREREILRLIASGASNREISRTLCLAESTVKTHVRNMMEKLHLHSRLEAMAYGTRKGLSVPTDDGDER